MSRPAEARAPLFVTMGEPGGIGPEVAVAAYKSLGGVAGNYPLRLVGDAEVFRAYAPLDDEAIVACSRCEGWTPGFADPGNAPAVTAAIAAAVQAALQGLASGIVTGPVQKASLMQAGFEFPGHTEYLQHLTGAKHAVMMLVGGGLRTVPLTIHTAIPDVPSRITKSGIVETARIVLASLARDFSIKHPRLAVAGLNPHAGEEGRLGRAEIETITPAIAELRAQGFAVSGPHPADTLFHAEARARYDAALCMYHDQALIPVKMLAFWEGVNVTLGLPIVRTSPDHGTALAIAGQHKADPRSMIAAIRLAATMADARRH
ncbi:MAG TPA: 4-hydroxythreonine-4-phosphate dehydrogenase PdxA [Rhizomicrobium sp.]